MKWELIETSPINKEILLRFETGAIGVGANVYKPTADDPRKYIMYGDQGEFKYLSKDDGVLTHWCEVPELPKEE